MNRSENVTDLITALAKAQLDFGHAVKGTTNPHFNMKYADLAANIDAVRPALNRQGIALLQFPSVDMEKMSVSVETVLCHGNQFISLTFEGPGSGYKGFSIQSIGAATTYLRRYGIQAICGLASEDDDGNSLAVDNPPPSVAKTAAPSNAEFELWHEAFGECETLDQWNKLIVPMMKERAEHPQYGKPFIKAAAAEAKLRGYAANRSTGLYEVAP